MRTFELDPNFERELCSSGPVREGLEEITRSVRHRASELAPDDPRTTGKDLHENIEADVGLGPRGFMGRVNAFDWKAGWYEFGSRRTPAVHFLSRALEENVGPLEKGADG